MTGFGATPAAPACSDLAALHPNHLTSTDQVFVSPPVGRSTGAITAPSVGAQPPRAPGCGGTPAARHSPAAALANRFSYVTLFLREDTADGGVRPHMDPLYLLLVPRGGTGYVTTPLVRPPLRGACRVHC